MKAKYGACVGFAKVTPVAWLIGEEACKHLEYCVPRAALVDTLFALVLKVAGAGAGFALFVYVLYRAVLGAKKAGGTASGEILAVLLLGLGTGIAPAPPREVKTESRQLGDQDESGDPPDPAPTEPTEPTRTKAE